MNNVKKKILEINLIRTACGVLSVIGAIVTYIIGRKKNDKKFKLASVAATVAGVALIGMELESNFKPVENDDRDNQ